MTVAILVIGLLALAVLFGWAANKVANLLAAFFLELGCFSCIALAVIIAGMALTKGGAGMLINANALHIPLADGCVHTIVTSPPY